MRIKSIIVVAALLIISYGCFYEGKSTNNNPNILFILVDDLGWADLGFTGSTFYETPNIDKLAASGLVFTDAYAPSPICSPS
ncbi:MAG TPA: sulfatase, partial [Mariniphaga anaerophila]|nr:sulfatase [Mariniphaga anaerophila]